MLSGQKFPKRKEFFLTFVDACGVNLETDCEWENAWDRLYLQRRGPQDQVATAEVERLRQQLAEIQQELAEALHAADADRTRAEQLTEALNAERRHRKEPETQPAQAGRQSARLGKHARATAALLNEASEAAMEIREKQAMAMMLAEAARVSAEIDLSQTRRLFDAAENAAGLVDDRYERAVTFAAVARALAASNQAESARQPKTARLFDAAEGAASLIQETETRSKAFAAIAQMAADSDPRRAKNIAWGITDPDQKDWALAYVAKAVARSNPVEAAILAKSITSKWPKSWALTALVEAARELERVDDVGRRLVVERPHGERRPT